MGNSYYLAFPGSSLYDLPTGAAGHLDGSTGAILLYHSLSSFRPLAAIIAVHIIPKHPPTIKPSIKAISVPMSHLSYLFRTTLYQNRVYSNQYVVFFHEA